MRRRTCVRFGGLVLGLALIAGPTAGCAGLGQGRPAAQAASPGPSATISPSAGPSVPAPDGRIDRAALLGARLDLPPWPKGSPSTCTTRSARLAGARTAKAVPFLVKTVYGDADGDGAQETISILGCTPGEYVYQQAVVFDRSAAGQVVALGQVVRMG